MNRFLRFVLIDLLVILTLPALTVASAESKWNIRVNQVSTLDTPLE